MVESLLARERGQRSWEGPRLRRWRKSRSTRGWKMKMDGYLELVEQMGTGAWDVHRQIEI